MGKMVQTLPADGVIRNRISLTLPLILLMFVTLGSYIIFKVPYGGFGDEQSHFKYAKYIFEHRQLPPVGYDVRKFVSHEVFQPPLYYLCASLFFFRHSDDQAVYWIRFFSLALAAATICLLWKTAGLVFQDPSYRFLATCITACNAQFLTIHCGVTNIAMASFTAALTLYLALQLIVDSRNLQHIALMGAAFGLTILSRTTTPAYLFPVCILAMVLRFEKAVKPVLVASVVFCGVALAVCGWWFLRNYLDYNDPFLRKIHSLLWGAGDLRKEPLSLFYVMRILAFLHCSFWAYFGLEQYHANVWEYSVYLLIEALGFIGVIEGMRKGPAALGIESGMGQRLYGVLAIAFVIGFLMIFSILIWVYAPMGRFLFIVIVPISILLSSGLLSITPQPWRPKASLWISLFLCCYALYLLIKYWYPHYV